MSAPREERERAVCRAISAALGSMAQGGVIGFTHRRTGSRQSRPHDEAQLPRAKPTWPSPRLGCESKATTMHPQISGYSNICVGHKAADKHTDLSINSLVTQDLESAVHVGVF